MDRSLQFFVNVYNDSKPKDPDGTRYNTSKHEVQYNINYFKKDDPNTITRTEQKTVSYDVLNSMQAEGQFLNYLGNSTTNDYNGFSHNPEHESDIKLSSIIEWSQKIPSMKLSYAHLAFHKDFGVYPANRLMVLRRFPGPVPDNIFNTKVSPLYTMATYYTLDKSPVDITFKENWEKFSGTFMDVLGNVIGIKVDDIPGVGMISKVASGSNLGQDIFNKIGQKLGIISEGGMPYGDPNIIYESIIRNVTGEDVSSGLSSTVGVTFTATYVLREINGIDAKAAMLDMLATITHMGSSDARFYITGNAESTINRIMKDMETGNIDGLFDDIVSGLTEIISSITDSIASAGSVLGDAAGSALSGDASGALDAIIAPLKAAGSSLLKQRFSRYKWQLRGAIGALSGMYTAPWHITIGNPKYPWFTCGNMYIDSAKVDVGGELAYNDMFTEITVTYTLKAGRSLGANELTNLFNAGHGRIYDTPDAIQTIFLPEDSTAKIPGQGTDPASSGADAGADASDTDDANALDNQTDHSLDNQTTDKNLEDSQKTDPAADGKNTYKVKSRGPNKHAEGYNAAGELIYTGAESFSLTADELIAEAKTALGDT